jgi:hypothetical protein
MKQVYARLPNVTVAPLYFAPEDISGDRLLAMMKVDVGSRKCVRYHRICTPLMTLFRYALVYGGHHGHPSLHGKLQLSCLPHRID